eukprot:m.159594 g.159594  ORF g.159594 m.159594 type:complete len:2077 (-) comp13373_c1_seq2:127-6357(-)
MVKARKGGSGRGGCGDGDGTSENVRVAVRIRPLNTAEIEKNTRTVAHKTLNKPHITLGDRHQFTFDDVFPIATDQLEVFDVCVSDLVEGSLKGRNATVLAYGQTGSGKTYTMGTGCEFEANTVHEGILPRASKHLFKEISRHRTEAKQEGITLPEFKVTVSFLELYQGKFYDLFDSTPGLRREANVRIRDDKTPDGAVTVNITGLTHKDVVCSDDIMDLLRRGSLDRVTASTDMNARSSRSHAIFTIWVTHRRVVKRTVPSMDENAMENHAESANNKDDDKESPTGSPETTTTTASSTTTNNEETVEEVVITTSKFNFVDLAGSERLKRTHATGERRKEGININSGLLALGNVISALGDTSRRSTHVPYRSNKLTRLLQDSLGGNSRTLMIACISPSDSDLMETLSTLKYANRARNIRNTVVINQDSASREIQFLREQMNKMSLELMEYRQGRKPLNPDSQEAEDLYHELNALREKNKSLNEQVTMLESHVESLEKQLVSAAVLSVSQTHSLTTTDKQKNLQQVMLENIELKSQLGTQHQHQHHDEENDEDGDGSFKPPPPPTSSALTESFLAMSSSHRRSSLTSSDLPSSENNIFAQSMKVMEELEATYGLELDEQEYKNMVVEDDLEIEDMNDNEHEDSDNNDDDHVDSDVESVVEDGPDIFQSREFADDDDDEDDADEDADEDADDEDADDNDDNDDDEEEDVDYGGNVSDNDQDRTFQATPSGKQEASTAIRSPSKISQSNNMSRSNSTKANNEQRQKKHEEMMIKYRELMHELGTRIVLHENLLRQLEIAQNEIKKQKQLYEKKLQEEQQQREEAIAERESLKSKLTAMSGRKHSEADLAVKLQYEKRMAELQSQLADLEKKARRQKRAEEDRQRAVSQITLLKRGISAAKAERKRLLAKAQEEVKKNKHMNEQQKREISQLKKNLSKEKQDASKYERQLRNRELRVQRVADENRKLKTDVKEKELQLNDLRHQIMLLKTKQARGTTAHDSRPRSTYSNMTPSNNAMQSSLSSSRYAPSKSRPKKKRSGLMGGLRRRRSSLKQDVQVEVDRKRAKLDQEVYRAVMYESMKSKLAEQLKRRDDELMKEKRAIASEKDRLNPSDDEDDAVRDGELDNELERVDMEMNLVTEEIRECQESIISMECQGIRGGVSRDEISEGGETIIQSTNLKQAHVLLRTMFVSLVRQRLAADKTRVRLAELEMEAKSKNAILRTLTDPNSSAHNDLFERIGTPGMARAVFGHGEPTSTVAMLNSPLNQTMTMPTSVTRTVSESSIQDDILHPLVNPVKTHSNASSRTSSISIVSSNVNEYFRDSSALSSASTKRRTGSDSSRRRRNRNLAGSQESLASMSSDGRMPRSTSPSSTKKRNKLQKLFKRNVSSPTHQPHYSQPTESLENKKKTRREFAGLQRTLRMPLSRMKRKTTIIEDAIVVEPRSTISSSSNSVGSHVLQLTHTVTGHSDEVLCVDACQGMLFSGSKDKTVRVWDLAAGKLAQVLENHESAVKSLSVNDTHFLTVCKNIVRVWDLRSREVMDKLNMKGDSIQKIDVDKSGTYVFAASGKHLRIWDLRMQREVKSCQLRGKVETLCLAPSGLDLALTTIDYKVRMFDVPDLPGGALKHHTLEPQHCSRVRALCFCGDVFFSGCDDSSIKKWMIREDNEWGLKQTKYGAHEGNSLTALGSMPSTKYFVSGSGKGSIKVWKSGRLTSNEEHKKHAGAITDFAYFGSNLFSSSKDKTVKIWNMSLPSISDEDQLAMSYGDEEEVMTFGQKLEDDMGFKSLGNKQIPKTTSSNHSETRPVSPSVDSIPVIGQGDVIVASTPKKYSMENMDSESAIMEFGEGDDDTGISFKSLADISISSPYGSKIPTLQLSLSQEGNLGEEEEQEQEKGKEKNEEPSMMETTKHLDDLVPLASLSADVITLDDASSVTSSTSSNSGMRTVPRRRKSSQPKTNTNEMTGKSLRNDTHVLINPSLQYATASEVDIRTPPFSPDTNDVNFQLPPTSSSFQGKTALDVDAHNASRRRSSLVHELSGDHNQVMVDNGSGSEQQVLDILAPMREGTAQQQQKHTKVPMKRLSNV